MSVNYTQWREMDTGNEFGRFIEDEAHFHWRIDEASGSEIVCENTGATGTINGATWVEGNWVGGWGLEFADNDWVSFTLDSDDFDEEQMWVSVAFEPAAPDTRGILASVVDVNNSDRWNLESGSWDTNGSVAWWMSGDTSVTSNADTITAGTQYHTIGIHDHINGYRELMLNDQSAGTAGTEGAVPAGEPTTFKIGRRGDGDRTFEGVIGEVMVGFGPLDDYEKTLLYDRQPFSQ